MDQKEDASTSVYLVTSQNDTTEANYHKDRKNDCDKETVVSTISAAFSGQTAAPQVTLKEKSQTGSTNKKQAKKELNLSGAGETDCSTYINLLDGSDIAQESLLYLRPVTASKKQGKMRKIGSLDFKEDTCDTSEISRNSPAEISNVDPTKKLTLKRRKKTKTSKVGLKQRTKLKPLPETFTESNDVMNQDVKNSFLVSDFTYKNEKEATCTAAEIHNKEPSKSTEAVLRSKRKKKTISPAASVRRSLGKKRSKLKSAKTVVTPEAITESVDFAGMSSDVSYHIGNQDCAIQNTEDKTRPPTGAKKSRKERIASSRSKCKRGRRAVPQLSTEVLSLQEQSETGLSKETTNTSVPAVPTFPSSQIKNPRKRAANTKKCKAEAVSVPVCVPFCDHSAANQCASAEVLMQKSDIKTEAAWEPVTQTLSKRRNTRRQRKKPAEKQKARTTLNFPVKEESDAFDMQCGTFNQKQQLLQETVMRNNSDRKYKGRDQRKRKKAEDKASEQTLNSDLNIKSEASWEVAPNQLDSPLMDIKTGSDERHSTPTKTPIKAQPHRKGKLPRKYTTPQHEDSLISCNRKGSHVRGFLINRRTKGVKKELMVDEATEKTDNISCEVLNAPDSLTNSQTKNRKVKVIADQDEALNAGKEERKNGYISTEKEEDANFDIMKKIKGKKKCLAVKRHPKVAVLVKENVGVMVSELQRVESGTTASFLLENVCKDIKDKREQKRKGRRAKKKLTSVSSVEGFDIAPNPPVSSLNENLQKDVSKRKRVKSELLTDSAVEKIKHVKLEPEDDVSAFLGGPKEESLSSTKCVTTRQGRPKSKRNMKTSLSEHTPKREEEVSDLKNVLMVSFEVDCQAPTGAPKWEEKTSKKKTVMGRTNMECSERQKPKCETGVLMNREMDAKSKIRDKRRKRKTCARAGKASKIAKVEDAFSRNEPVLATFNAVKEEHSQSKTSELKSEGTSLSQDKISLVESSAAPKGKSKIIRKRSRRKKTGWTVRKKLKQPWISARCSNPVSGNDGIKDESYVKLRNTEQTLIDQAEEMTANTEVKPTYKLKTHDPRHQKRKSQKPLQCCFCGRSFRHITAFTVHKRIHTGEKPYRCPTCGKNFTQFSQLKVHSKLHGGSCAVCCPFCGGKFKNKHELIVHLHVHMKDFESSTVVEDTTGKGANNNQVEDCLDSPAAHNKQFKCSVCMKELLNQATFKMHRRTHGGKRRTCSVCWKKFPQSSSLNAHEKTHWPVKPYSCSVCCKAFVKLQQLKPHSQMHSGPTPFSCARCEKSISRSASLRSHQVASVCSDKQNRTRSDIYGFLISQSAEGQIVTPAYFKCPICKQLHHYWCQYVLHLQIHTHSKSYTCKTCKQQYGQAAEMRSHCTVCCRQSGEERACRSSLTEIWKEPEAPETRDDQGVPPDEDQTDPVSPLPQLETGEKEVTYIQSPPPSPNDSSPSVNDYFDISASPDRASGKPSRVRPRSFFRRHCGRYSCGQCGRSFSQWNKLWLHQRFHRRTNGPFSCTHCDLEFRFLGSYIDHLREHAAQTPYACPLCPDTFTNIENLSAHISECHKQHDYKKCNTCGKIFSTLRNLKKHKLLHKGANSHFCLSCNLSFSSNIALKSHLKTHRPRLNVPKPAGLVEPLLFPYHCRKCTAKFSSTELLQAHQVCHFTAGKKPETPSESAASFIPSRTPGDTQGVVSESSRQKRHLPVSNKKHLFRYPHPDRLYVVPVVSSEPPVVISDTEEESLSTTLQPDASFNSSYSKSLYIPQSSTRRGRSKNQLQDHSDKFLLGSHQDLDFNVSDSDSSEVTPHFVFSKEKELVDDTHSCAVCMKTFTAISKLHEHYIDHARGI